MAIDWAVVVATFAGPIVAVQAQKYLERRREQHQRRVVVFQTLMRTRSALLSPDHVNALNAIPLEFYGKSKRLGAIVGAWRTYLDHLGERGLSQDVWASRRVDLLVDLLEKMGRFLNYEFDSVYIRKGFYAPEGHARLENEQELARRLILELLAGDRALTMDIRKWPVDPAAADLQRQMQAAMLEWAKRAAPPQSQPPVNEPK